ncbi:MAG: SPFH/Band 7/PHB domain protein [Chloroflexi bacterium]|nr:SPFH/Band 7/PHB domain protein [Chloroflexota bacterium]MDA1002677.1 SPFH/Band 7/PHB domain protein [Chloroflexota bacterium]MQC27578.1 SPFH/Band 7/PHB domain protein [Chloroflexota bacterium]
MFFISVIKQYERAVIFRLGRYAGTRGPGLVILIPFIDRGVRVDMRERVLDEPAQSSITQDNALVDIDYVVYMRVVDAEAAVINVQDFTRAVRNLATTTLRSVIGDITVEEVLSQRDRINMVLQQKLAAETVRWGVEVKAVEIREITPQHDIQQAMTRLLTADRTKRALITESEGDRQAAINRAEGAKQASILEAEGAREAQILRAEGSRQAAILNAEGFAMGLDRIYQVAERVDANTMGLQYLEMMKQLGQGASTKWIIPMDLSAMAGPIGEALSGFGRNGNGPAAAEPAREQSAG